MISDLLYRLRALFHRESVEAEMDAELRAHFEHLAEKFVLSGLTPEEAGRRARLESGGLDQIKEDCRDAWGVRFIEALFQDVRYGVRVLRRNPGFAATAILILALGIGPTTAIFSVVDTLMLKPLPFPTADRLVRSKYPPAKPGALGCEPLKAAIRRR